jgi:hypothetical protein
MVKRVLLAFTFVAALGAASFGISSQAKAWSDCNSGYAYSSYPYTYPTYAVGYVGYAPRVAYYPAVPVRTYPVYYGRRSDGHHHHHDHHHDGLTISFGF